MFTKRQLLRAWNHRISNGDWNEGLEKGNKVVFRDIFPYKIIHTIQCWLNPKLYVCDSFNNM